MTIENSNDADALNQILLMGREIIAALDRIRETAEHSDVISDLDRLLSEQARVVAELDDILSRNITPAENEKGEAETEF